jgi:hypothetical protein
LQGEPGFQLKPRNFFNFNHDDMLGKAHPLRASCTEPLSIYAQNELKQNIKSDLLEMVDRRCKPTKWNQGGYDGFHVSADDDSKISIDFFQVTRGASHPLNLKYFAEVLNLFIYAELQVRACQIYFVVPEGQTTTISKVTPYGSVFQQLFGWVSGREKEKIRVVTLMKTTSVTTP